MAGSKQSAASFLPGLDRAGKRVDLHGGTGRHRRASFACLPRGSARGKARSSTGCVPNASERSYWLSWRSCARLRPSNARRLLAFLPDGTEIRALSGELETEPLLLNGTELTQRALALRHDYLAEQRRFEQYRLEQRAAERLRFPEPVVNAGLKRADIGPRVASGPVVGITVPLPLFNQGRTEVARYSAEQERTAARLHVLARQIRASVEGATQAFAIRQRARDEYRSQLAGTGPELVRIATVAYQEGEIGILQLLDAYRVQRQSQLRMIEIHAAVKEAQIELERIVGEEFGR
jgi:outer membrane protein TolC